MLLERDTSPTPRQGRHSQDADAQGYKRAHRYPDKICASFSDFGGQNSHFNVYIDWGDIEQAIQKFVELNHPSAVRLARARDLAQAVADYMAANTPPPQSN